MTKDYHEVTILMVEDDDIDAMTIKRAFKKLKLLNPLIRAVDGLDALEYLRGSNEKDMVERPYVLLLDINMPRMNGLELLTEIRNDPNLKDIPVFVLTTSKSDEDMIAAHNHNVVGYIVKSEAADGFIRVIELLDSYWRVVTLPS
jgi:CheY-like chemotaxis protein